jgi:hypothetical protein
LKIFESDKMPKKLSDDTQNKIIKTTSRHANSPNLHTSTTGGGIGTGQASVQSEQLQANALK